MRTKSCAKKLILKDKLRCFIAFEVNKMYTQQYISDYLIFWGTFRAIATDI